MSENFLPCTENNVFDMNLYHINDDPYEPALDFLDCKSNDFNTDPSTITSPIGPFSHNDPTVLTVTDYTQETDQPPIKYLEALLERKIPFPSSNDSPSNVDIKNATHGLAFEGTAQPHPHLLEENGLTLIFGLYYRMMFGQKRYEDFVSFRRKAHPVRAHADNRSEVSGTVFSDILAATSSATASFLSQSIHNVSGEEGGKEGGDLWPSKAVLLEKGHYVEKIIYDVFSSSGPESLTDSQVSQLKRLCQKNRDECVLQSKVQLNRRSNTRYHCLKLRVGYGKQVFYRKKEGGKEDFYLETDPYNKRILERVAAGQSIRSDITSIRGHQILNCPQLQFQHQSILFLQLNLMFLLNLHLVVLHNRLFYPLVDY